MKSLLGFIAGITIGAGVSWVYHKNKYEQMVQEEIESLREHMKEKSEVKENPKDELQTAEEMEKEYDESINKVHDIAKENNYISSEDEENMINRNKKPFVVTPEDFASMPGYDTDTFYYHRDDIISNDNQEIVDDVEQILGLSIPEIKEQFGIYEDDAVYIRNTRMKCDYEILREEENYKRRNGD